MSPRDFVCESILAFSVGLIYGILATVYIHFMRYINVFTGTTNTGM